jgi:predicted O-linked N-acetylglucosamine transferase (SPINDLY family)
MLLVRSKRPSEGLPHLLAALSADPQVADYWLGYLEALLVAGQAEKARSTLALARRHGLAGRPVEEFAARLNVKLSTVGVEAPPAGMSRSATAEVVRPEPRPATRVAQRLETQVLAFVEGRDFAAAKASARILTQQFPDRGLGWKILGALLAADGEMDEALAAMHEAARLLPEDAEVFSNLGATLTKLERLEEAEAMFRLALADCRPGDLEHHDLRFSGLLFSLSHKPELGAAELFAEHLAIGRWLEGPSVPAQPTFSNTREPERRLKIGFVSGDFRTHPVAKFFEPVLETLRDHGGLELHAFYNHDTEDATTRRMQGSFAHWHPVNAVTDLELVKLVKKDRIDILLDMSGHTSCNRLRALALKAAPIQVSWMGYPGTTGLLTMDYYLADPHFLPPGQFDDQFTEKIAYLPASSSFRPHADSPPVNGLPALEAGFLTFGSFNRIGKLNPFTIRLWCRLLRELPNSILVMAAMPLDERRQVLAELFNAEGVASERLAFFPRSDMATYLGLHHQIDICLDTFPYTGGTTTHHALWMGVPTLTLAGQTPASRQGAANLIPVGLDGFIANSPDDFAQKGLSWSTRLTELAHVRSDLRERWLGSVRQHDIVARGLDAALRHMWRRWCAGLPTESFHLDSSNLID